MNTTLQKDNTRPGMDRTRWLLVGVGGLILIGLLLLVILLGGGGSGEGSATVEEFTGSAFACPRTTGCSTPSVLGARVFVGGEARTGATGFQDLHTGTATFRLQENATLQFRQVTDAATFLLVQSGRVFANHEPGGQITVQAGDVRVDAVDTRFCVVVSGASTYIAVPQPTGGKGTHPGSVQITADGKQTTMQAGHETIIGPGQAGGVRPISPAEQQRWNALSNWP